MHGRDGKCVRRLVLKTVNEETTWRHMSRYKDSIIYAYREIGCDVVEWIHLAQNRDRGGLS
jgi:hypothetical protein